MQGSQEDWLCLARDNDQSKARRHECTQLSDFRRRVCMLAMLEWIVVLGLSVMALTIPVGFKPLGYGITLVMCMCAMDAILKIAKQLSEVKRPHDLRPCCVITDRTGKSEESMSAFEKTLGGNVQCFGIGTPIRRSIWQVAKSVAAFAEAALTILAIPTVKVEWTSVGAQALMSKTATVPAVWEYLSLPDVLLCFTLLATVVRISLFVRNVVVAESFRRSLEFSGGAWLRARFFDYMRKACLQANLPMLGDLSTALMTIDSDYGQVPQAMGAERIFVSGILGSGCKLYLKNLLLGVLMHFRVLSITAAAQMAFAMTAGLLMMALMLPNQIAAIRQTNSKMQEAQVYSYDLVYRRLRWAQVSEVVGLIMTSMTLSCLLVQLSAILVCRSHNVNMIEGCVL